MLSTDIREFVENVLNNSIEYDDEFSNILEQISVDINLQNELISVLENIESKLTKTNVNYILSLVMELTINHEINMKTLYPMFFRIMFYDYSLDYSLCYRFCKLLIYMKDNDKEFVLNEIIKKITPDDLIASRISLCSLYGNFDFGIIEQNLVNTFLNKILTVLECYNNNAEFKNDIKNFLLPKINCQQYLIYYKKFKDLI